MTGTDRIADAFEPAKDSIDGAEEAVNELHADIRRFFEFDATETVTDFDSKTGENVRKIRLKRQLPRRFRHKASEALRNSKYAFDQATYAVYFLTTGKRPKVIYFPWSSSPADLEHLLKTRGIDQRFWNVFAKHEPYPTSEAHTGGNDTIRTLAKMVNDKHTVGLSIVGYVASAEWPSVGGGTGKSISLTIPIWDPVKNEVELARWIGNLAPNDDHSLRLQIIFKDARLTKPVDAVNGAGAFAAKAKLFCEELEARCHELGLGV